MGFMMCFIVPTVLILCVLFACKWTNFSILPEELKGPQPREFKIPKLKRNGYKWQPDYESSDDESSDDESSDDESSDDESSDEGFY